MSARSPLNRRRTPSANINGQQGWSKTGRLRRGRRERRAASRLLRATASAPSRCASQTQSPAEASATRPSRLASRSPARKTGLKLFVASFSLRHNARTRSRNTSLHMTVSPDDGQGGTHELPALRRPVRRHSRVLPSTRRTPGPLGHERRPSLKPTSPRSRERAPTG